MPDRKKVMRGLEVCSSSDINKDCPQCPYYMHTKQVVFCVDRLMHDSLVLLEEQEDDIKPIESTTEQKKFADRIGFAVSEFWCGECHFNLVGHPKFCPNCGKKVKWDG